MTYRGRLRRRDRRAVAGAAAAGVVLAVVLHHGAAGPAGTSIPATVAAAPSGSARTWAVEFLTAIREPVTGCNVGAITAWEAAEGGGVTNDAAYNPLNTARTEPGSWTVNSAGVQAFPSWPEGLAANVAAITNGLYGPVLAALRAGNDAQGVADAVGASPWGTSPFTAACQ